MKMLTVKQVAKVSGVSVRTLHHYDEIGLLKPAHTGRNRYRYYGEEELLRLQQILLHRELGMPLGEIANMLRAGLPDRADKIPARRLPPWLAGVVALFDKSLRDSSAWLDVVRLYDGSSGANLLDRPLRPTREALFDCARSLLDRGLS